MKLIGPKTVTAALGAVVIGTIAIFITQHPRIEHLRANQESLAVKYRKLSAT